MTTPRLKRALPFSMLLAVFLIYAGLTPWRLNAQSEETPVVVGPVHTGVSASSTAVQNTEILPEPGPQSSQSGAGLVITPTFDTNTMAGTAINAATQTVINNAIAFYESIFTNNLGAQPVAIYYYNMSSGLGESTFYTFSVSYSSYRTALASKATSFDDTTALANTASGSTNPINGNSNIIIKGALGRALGFNTPQQSFNYTGSPCPTFTGDVCIGLNVTLANNLGDLISTIEHEMDEALGLGSALNGNTTPSVPWAQDLFRWASSGTRSYSANPDNNEPCANGTPAAFFSIDGGKTNLNQFNNCNNGGDYGDWITHTPSQVQDAFTNATAGPSLNITSSEVRDLDVIGWTLIPKIRRRLTSE